MKTHDIARLGLAQSPEGRRIFPRMSVYENLQIGASLGQGDFCADLERILRDLSTLKDVRAGQRGATLSAANTDARHRPAR